MEKKLWNYLNFCTETAMKTLMSCKKTIPSEAEEQIALVEWLNYHPILKNYFCKNDNEGQRKTVMRDGKLVPVGLFHAIKMGLRPGVSDLFIYYPTMEYNGLWLEIKRNKKYTMSEMSTATWTAQEAFQEQVKKVGFSAHFCYGCGDAIEIIESYLVT